MIAVRLGRLSECPQGAPRNSRESFIFQVGTLGELSGEASILGKADSELSTDRVA